MRTVLLALTLVISSMLSAQTALDSIQLYGYPVRDGKIYKYDPRENFAQACASNLCIVSVVTPSDSVFHFDEGVVSSVFTVDGNYGIIVLNAKGESVTYSNLKQVNLRKGDEVKRGMYLGTTGISEYPASGMNQVDILILRNVNALPYKKSVDYIRNTMSMARTDYTL